MPADDTRDIAIQTRADVKHMSDEIRLLTTAVGDLKADLNERRGAEKVARVIYSLGSGTVGSTLTILAAKFMGVPLPR